MLLIASFSYAQWLAVHLCTYDVIDPHLEGHMTHAASTTSSEILFTIVIMYLNIKTCHLSVYRGRTRKIQIYSFQKNNF